MSRPITRRYSATDYVGRVWYCEAGSALEVPELFRQAGKIVNSPLTIRVVATGELVKVACRSDEPPRMIWE